MRNARVYNLDTMTIRKIIAALSPQQFWAIASTVVVAIVGVFSFGYFIANTVATVDDAKLQTGLATANGQVAVLTATNSGLKTQVDLLQQAAALAAKVQTTNDREI